jgi:prepilin-type processing-associated H-X9-DG protein
MLVVSTVIVILASLLLPALSRTKVAARSAGCKANLHQLGLALRMYVDDFATYPLLCSPIDLTRTAGPWKDWPRDLAPYVQATVGQALYQTSFLCTERFQAQPGLRAMIKSAPAYNAYGYNGSGCAADGDQYGLGLGNPTWMDPNWSLLWPSGTLRLIETSESKVRQPDDMIAITCSNSPDQRSVGPSRNLIQFWPANSHSGGANGLFCDSRVEHRKQALWIEMTDQARRRWNNDHEPHWEALR